MMRLNIVVRTLQREDVYTGFECNATTQDIKPGDVLRSQTDFDPQGFKNFNLEYIQAVLDILAGNSRANEYRIRFMKDFSDTRQRRRIINALIHARGQLDIEIYFWESFRIMNDTGNEVVTQSISTSMDSRQQQ